PGSTDELFLKTSNSSWTSPPTGPESLSIWHPIPFFLLFFFICCYPLEDNKAGYIPSRYASTTNCSIETVTVKLRVLTLLLSLPLSTAYAKPSSLLDMDFEELMEKRYVTIASGSPVAINRAPAVATVITAADIRAMGATDLDQVLAAVPGLYVSNTFSNYNPIYAFRGIYSQVNTETLLLLNGVPMTSLYRGDRGGIWGGMPVRSIARIEIIRGPGSAVY